MFYGQGYRLGRRRRRPRDDPRRHLAQRRPLLLGPVRSDQRVAGRRDGRDHRPPPPEPRRLAGTAGPSARTCRIGAIRNMKNPGRFGQPDTHDQQAAMPAPATSTTAACTPTAASGNRTFYLISQGGTAGRADRARHRRAVARRSRRRCTSTSSSTWSPAATTPTSAAVLDRSCRALARHHTVADDRGRTAATSTGPRSPPELRTTPPRAKQPPDAPMACPTGHRPACGCCSTPRAASPANKFDAGSTWLRAPNASVFPPVAANATSGHTLLVLAEPDTTPTVSSLTMHPVALPAGRPAYLWFQQWRLMEAATRPDGSHRNFDGGTVEVGRRDARRAAAPGRGAAVGQRPARPDHRHVRATRPPAASASAATAAGYLASRLKLTRYAGHAVVAAVHDEHRRRRPDDGLVPRRHPRLHLRSRARPAERRRSITRHGDGRAPGSTATPDAGRRRRRRSTSSGTPAGARDRRRDRLVVHRPRGRRRAADLGAGDRNRPTAATPRRSRPRRHRVTGS